MADQEISGKEFNYGDNSEGDMDCEDEAYVHEGFLADLEAGSSKSMVHNGSLSCYNNGNSQPIRSLQYRGSGSTLNCASILNDSGQSQLDTGTENALFYSNLSSPEEKRTPDSKASS